MVTRVRNNEKMQELSRQVEALRTKLNTLQVDHTLSCLKKMHEQALLSQFVQARYAALWQARNGNPKYREANSEIVVVYEAVVCSLAPRDMRLALYDGHLWYRGEHAD